jgi:hypothetical protein
MSVLQIKIGGVVASTPDEKLNALIAAVASLIQIRSGGPHGFTIAGALPDGSRPSIAIEVAPE